MASDTDGAKHTVESDAQLPEYGGNGERDAQLRDGLYVLRNKKARTVLDLAGNNYQCCGLQWCTNAAIGNQRWLIQRNQSSDTYTVQNLQHSTFLDVQSGSSENEAKVIPSPRYLVGDSRRNQEWHIEEQEPGQYTLKCARTSTFLEIAGGNPSDGANVTCSGPGVEKDHQLWILEHAGRTASEIKAIFEAWKPNIIPRIVQLHAEQTEYFVLPHELRQSLWQSANILQQPVRPGIFDLNYFVIKSKETLSTWARNQYPVQVQGVSVLFGIIYGETKQGPRAYNWYLTRDMCSLMFFDAQTGQEYSPTALDGFGFEPGFVTF